MNSSLSSLAPVRSSLERGYIAPPGCCHVLFRHDGVTWTAPLGPRGRVAVECAAEATPSGLGIEPDALRRIDDALDLLLAPAAAGSAPTGKLFLLLTDIGNGLGLGASVHPSEYAAYNELLNVFASDLAEEEIAEAKRLLDAGEFGDLEEHIGDFIDSTNHRFAVESHDAPRPQALFADRLIRLSSRGNFAACSKRSRFTAPVHSPKSSPSAHRPQVAAS